MRAMVGGLMAAVVLGACSGGGTGGSGGAGGSGGSAGGGSGGSAGGGAGGAGGSATSKLGSVSLSQLEGIPVLGAARSGSAGFYPDGPPTVVGGLACTFTNMAGCQVSDCLSDGGVPTFTGGRLTGAGAITVQAGAVSMPLTQMSFGSYSGSANDGGLWWTGGEAVTATAVGSTDGGVPAFTASFTAPTKLTLTAPANDGGTLVVTKGVALPVTWTAGSGTVRLDLQSGQLVGGRSVKLSCTANASAGTFTFTSALTQLLLSTTAGTLQISNTSETTVTPGGWSILATASTTGPTRVVTVP